MTKISEAEFAKLVAGIIEDRETIIKHNPLGTREEILLWMLLSVLVSYLNLAEIESPCFKGKPDAETYRQAIVFVLNERRVDSFDIEPFLKKIVDAS
ncbi:MAG TPA: hypothetical protein PKA82_04620 [Pyrinomonadaceae bacterium]|nr:hypothetical protein [Pyrinomonadaceae bacterium]